MVKLIHSLQMKLTASFVILIILISGMITLLTYGATKQALKDRVRDKLQAIASQIALDLDGNALAALKPGDEATPEYSEIKDYLNRHREASQDITYIYTMRKTTDGVEFLVDADYGTEDDAASIGDKYDLYVPELMEGFIRPSADKEFTTDKWGTVLSGYAPVKNNRGQEILVGIDMDSSKVIAAQHYISLTIHYVLIAAILCSGLIILLFSKTIIRDIRKLNKAANDISMGNLGAIVDVKRKDEIGELADSFSRMGASLKIMMAFDDKSKKCDLNERHRK